MNTYPIPSAKAIVTGLGLVSVVAPALLWLDVWLATRGNSGFFTFLAVVAGLTGIGYLLYGAYAFFTSFDAIAARYLGVDGSAATATTASSTHSTTSSTSTPTSSTPFPTFPTSSRPSSRASAKLGRPTAGSLLAGPPIAKPDAPPTTPREDGRTTPLPPSDDDKD